MNVCNGSEGYMVGVGRQKKKGEEKEEHALFLLVLGRQVFGQDPLRQGSSV
jgi:hypothetical protein